MKEIYLSFFCFVLLISNTKQSKAATQSVLVTNFAFTPASFAINVGDTVLFLWGNGTHTTSSATIPIMAQPWDAPMSMNSPVFMYVPTVAGTYDYVCSFHPSMVASFTVSSATGLASIPSPVQIMLNSNNPVLSDLNIDFYLSNCGMVKIDLFNIIGNHVQNYVSEQLSAGFYKRTITVAELTKGIYFLEMQSQGNRMTKRIVIQ